jgi:hypothetical protein
MNHFLKAAYDAGADRALAEFGLRKSAGYGEDVTEFMGTTNPLSKEDMQPWLERYQVTPEMVERERRDNPSLAPGLGGLLGGVAGAAGGGLLGGALGAGAGEALDLSRDQKGVATLMGLLGGATLGGGGLGSYLHGKGRSLADASATTGAIKQKMWDDSQGAGRT